MKALFAHDHIFFRRDSQFFSNGGLSYEVLSRYLKYFETLTVISRQSEVSDAERLTLAGGEGVSFISVPNFKSAKEIFTYFKAKKIVDDAVRNSDCVIARMPSAIASLAIASCVRHGKPYVIEVVGCAWDANVEHGSLVGKVIAPFQYLGMRRAISRSKFNIYITKRFLQERYPSRNAVSGIAPNVKLGVTENSVLEKRLNKISGRGADKLVRFGLIGSLDVDYKGHETVLEALAIARNRLPPFQIEFLGKGDRSRWMELVSRLKLDKYVKFIGSLPAGDEVLSWIDSLDVQIQPSKAEAQGRSILEGMSRGCPIIATKVGGIVELIDNTWLINSGDSRGLAERIEALVSDKAEMIRQAKRNFDEAISYRADIVEKSRSDFFEKFLHSCSR